MAENKLAVLSTEFAVKILTLTDGIKGTIPWQTNLNEAAQVLEQTSEKLNTLTAKPILLPSYK